MKYKTILIATALTALVTWSVVAQPPMGRHHGGGAAMFDSLAADFDANQDGTITADELGAEQTFAHFDKNADGVITAEDFARRGGRERFRTKMGRGPGGPGMGHGAMAGGFLVRAADSDRDRTVTAAEFDAFTALVDPNGDGVVDADELAAAFGGGPGFGAPDRAHPLDRDGDGTLEVADFAAVFTELDTNGDGDLAGDELPAFGRGMRDRHGRAGGMIFRHADADQDHAVTAAEWQGLVARIDADGSGEITEAEWTAAIPGPPNRELPPEFFARISDWLDRNDNGVVEPSDLDAIFSAHDADADGVVEGSELWGGRGRRHARP